MLSARIVLFSLLGIVLVGGCGGDDEMTTPGPAGSVSCDDSAPACLSLDESRGYRNQTCVEFHSSPLPATFESDCVTEDTATRTFLTDGCPRDDGRVGHCIQHTTLGGSSGFTAVYYWYATGNDLVDSRLRDTCAESFTADTDAGASPAMITGTWCPGSLP